MKYALFPVLLMLCTGCGTLATSGMEAMPADIDQVAPEVDGGHITSTPVDNDDLQARLSEYPKKALVTRIAVQDSPSADIPEEAFLDTAYRDTDLFPIEADNSMAHPPARDQQGECVIHCNNVARWAARNPDTVLFIFDLAYRGGSELVRLFSGSKKKVSGKSRRSSGRSVRKANRTRSERTPKKGSSQGRGRR